MTTGGAKSPLLAPPDAEADEGATVAAAADDNKSRLVCALRPSKNTLNADWVSLYFFKFYLRAGLQ